MTPKEYQELCQRTKSESESPIEDLIHASMGFATETGEFTDPIKRLSFYKLPLNTENLIEELGDIMWYVAIAATALNVDIDTIMQKNIAKLQARYPEKFTSELAANRDIIAEYDAMNAINGGE